MHIKITPKKNLFPPIHTKNSFTSSPSPIDPQSIDTISPHYTYLPRKSHTHSTLYTLPAPTHVTHDSRARAGDCTRARARSPARASLYNYLILSALAQRLSGLSAVYYPRARARDVANYWPSRAGYRRRVFFGCARQLHAARVYIASVACGLSWRVVVWAIARGRVDCSARWRICCIVSHVDAAEE